VVILVFVVGLALGVALNALADDLPPDELGQRRALRLPHCRYCETIYPPHQWLALSHWVLRQGRCGHCGGPRRGRHPVLELFAGLCLAGLWVWAKGQWAAFLPAVVLTFIFTLVTVVDIEHRLVLWRVVLPAAVGIGLMQAALQGGWKTLGGGLAGYGLVLGLFLLGQLFSVGLARLRGRPLDEVAFGSGDVNVAALVGLAVGWPGVLLALLVTIFSGGLFSLAFLVAQLLRRRYNPYTAIPYGPFLAFGAAVIYLYGHDLAAWYMAQR